MDWEYQLKHTQNFLPPQPDCFLSQQRDCVSVVIEPLAIFILCLANKSLSALRTKSIFHTAICSHLFSDTSLTLALIGCSFISSNDSTAQCCLHLVISYCDVHTLCTVSSDAHSQLKEHECQSCFCGVVNSVTWSVLMKHYIYWWLYKLIITRPLSHSNVSAHNLH